MYPTPISRPHFSADDSELVFDRYNEIDAARIDTGKKRMIVQNTTTMIKSPAVSPDGRDVAYHARCFTDTGVSVWTTPFNTNTGVCQGRRVSPPGDFDSQRPAWGSSDLFAYEKVDKATNLATIVVMSRNAGTMPCPLTPSTSDSRNPTWSP